MNQKNQAHVVQRLAKVFRDIEAAGAVQLDDLNGAIAHDVGVVCASLPKRHRGRFEQDLRAMVGAYLPLTRGIKILEPA